MIRRIKNFFYGASRLTLALVFLYAGFVKIQDIVGFAGQIANYQLLPYAWNYVAAVTLPYIEVMVGFMLLTDFRVRPTLLILFVLNTIFILALLTVMARGFSIDCGCFDPSSNNTTPPFEAIIRDVGFIALAVIAWFSQPKEQA